MSKGKNRLCRVRERVEDLWSRDPLWVAVVEEARLDRHSSRWVDEDGGVAGHERETSSNVYFTEFSEVIHTQRRPYSSGMEFARASPEF